MSPLTPAARLLGSSAVRQQRARHWSSGDCVMHFWEFEHRLLTSLISCQVLTSGRGGVWATNALGATALEACPCKRAGLGTNPGLGRAHGSTYVIGPS